jgi:L-alanine-DL-glutamate epimerase-like enolase superfamily enzyme
MLIEGFETALVEVPLPRSSSTSIHRMTSVGCVLLTLRTDDGLTGEGMAFTLNADRIRAFDETVRGFAPYVIGQDPRNVEKVFADVWTALNPTGHKGITIGALSAIDVALWDIVGKAANMPLAKLFGGMRDRVDTYASSGLWLSDSIEDLVDEAQRFLNYGFWGMKIRVGSDYPETDVERVRAVREAVGPEIDLYVDINQALSPKQAIRLGRKLEQFNLVWIEEPVAYTDLAGHAMVRKALDTPIASGETEYTRFGMQAYLDAGAVDVLMPDLQRMGGFTEFRKASALASTRNVNISTHIFTEYSLSLAGSLPNCVSVEHMDWFQPLFNEGLEFDGGQLVIPDRPGTGFTFDSAAVDRIRLA